MPRRLDDTTRNRIIADLHAIAEDAAEERSAGAIGRDYGVSHQTVTRIAKGEGLDHLWDRSLTKRAGDAAQADNRTRRAHLARDLLDDIAQLRARFFSPYKVAVATAEGVEIRTMDEPPADAIRNLVTSAAVLIDKHLALERMAVEAERHAEVDAWLSAVTGPPGLDDGEADEPEG